jgi:ion channel
VLTLLKVVVSNVALLGIYYLLPLDRTSTGGVIALLGVALVALTGLIALQVRAIIRAEYPVLKAVGALATSAPLFLLLFAGTYYVLGNLSAGNFSESMTRTDALYFTVTVFATVGFGDITAVSEPARALVTGQMVAGIVIVGLGARIIVDAIKHGREQVPVPSRAVADSPAASGREADGTAE